MIYIPSLYPLIYDYLDRAIVQSLREIQGQVNVVHPRDIFSTMNSIKSPHIAFTLLGDHLPQQSIDQLKNLNIKLAIWLTEDPFYIDETIHKIHQYDYVFTVDLGAYKKYRALGFEHVYHLPLGTDPSIFMPMKTELYYCSDVLLVGYPYPSRVQLVEYLLEHGEFSITVIGNHWINRIPKRFRHHPNLTIHNKWLDPTEIAKFYNGTKIVLNSHRSSLLPFNKNKENVINETINNRSFDIAACSAFQLIDDMRDLRNYFSEEEVISYKNQRDCLEKINFYLKDSILREEFATNARKKVMQEHTFKHRIESILKTVKNN